MQKQEGFLSKENISKSDMKQINACFDAYIFYTSDKRGNRECTCTACGKTYTVPILKRTMNSNDYLFVTAKHNETVTCPECGVSATLKNIGKAKTRRNLYEERRIVIIHKINHNTVHAQAFHAIKNYEYSLNPQIGLYPSTYYKFNPGKAQRFKYSRYYGLQLENRTIGEPFLPKFSMYAWLYGPPDNRYIVIGLNRLKSTFLKYNMLDDYCDFYARGRTGIVEFHFMKYLTAFCLYPQIEMLQKLGHYDVIKNLVEVGKKSFPYVNWKTKTPQDFFKVSRQDYKLFHEAGGKLEILKVRQELIKHGGTGTVAEACKYYQKTPQYYNFDNTVKFSDENQLDLRKTISYIAKQSQKHKNTYQWTSIAYRDYIRMNKEMNISLEDKIVLYPPHIIRAHDRTTELHRAFLDEKRRKDNLEAQRKAKAQLKRNDKQYKYSDGQFIIIVPHTVDEIIREGKETQHCVGGYADRHMKGVCTILFLRAADQPNKALYTIEMRDKALCQIQGYNNRTPLTPEAEAFFNTWLEWVKKGSRRRKDGTPIIKNIKTAAKTA